MSSYDFDEKKAEKALNSNKEKATAILNDSKKSEAFIKRVEEKMQNTPLGGVLDTIPTLIALIKSYIKKEYKEVPVGSIIAIIAALLYWVSPVDIIPDFIPVFGFIDDAAVIMFCLKSVQSDLNAYKEWQAKQKA